MTSQEREKFARVIAEGRALQRHLPWLEMVVVGLEHKKVDDLVVPTAEETLRIKAFLCTDRQALRDYLDLAAVADTLGDDVALRALRFLNVLYPGAGNQTCITRLAEVTSQGPVDLGQHDLKTYRGIQAPYDDWRYVEQRCRDIARKLLVMELDGAVATDVDEFLASADVQDLRQHDDKNSGPGRQAYE